MKYNKDLTVIIPTRGPNIFPWHKDIAKKYHTQIIIDENKEGQHFIRLNACRYIKTKYVLFLDDDVEPHNDTIEILLSEIMKNRYVFVCGEFIPVIHDRMTRYISKYKQNIDSIYSTGLTIWDRKKFIHYANLPGIPSQVGDLVLIDELKANNEQFIKRPDALADHHLTISLWSWIKYRFKAGTHLAWYLRKYRKKGYLKLTLKILISLPLSKNYVIFLYKLSTGIGLIVGRVIF
jgi:glycosyltransferase involved in cell wall biosynthesis